MIPYHTKLGADGRIVIPAQCRQALKLSPGEEIIINVENEEAVMYSVEHAIKRAQAKVKQHTKGKVNLSQMLINMRRAEEKNE